MSDSDTAGMVKLRYKPLLEIGAGGMATVHLGIDNDRPLEYIAIKRPHRHLLRDEKFMRALCNEARVARMLCHPNVVGIVDTEPLADGLQLVMAYVEGTTLYHLLASWADGGARLPASVAIRVVLDVCAGLASLHELCDSAERQAGFIHRDVSPQNILVGLDGIARITDFGLAKCAWSTDQQTTEGTLKGKLGYMAPEYVRGHAIDLRADVFALGVVCWESLTGSRLFRGNNEADSLDRILNAAVPSVSQFQPELGTQWDEVIGRALCRDQDARYPNTREFARDLLKVAQSVGAVCTQQDVGACVFAVAGEELKKRRVFAKQLVKDLRRKKQGSLSRLVLLLALLGLSGAGLWLVRPHASSDRLQSDEKKAGSSAISAMLAPDASSSSSLPVASASAVPSLVATAARSSSLRPKARPNPYR